MIAILEIWKAFFQKAFDDKFLSIFTGKFYLQNKIKKVTQQFLKE